MKKTVLKIVALSLAAVMVCALLASCGTTLSGTYSNKVDVFGVSSTETVYKFTGKKVSIKVATDVMGLESAVEFEGTYKIEDDKITFTFGGEGAEYSGTVPFAKTDDGIKIAGVEYKKQ